MTAFFKTVTGAVTPAGVLQLTRNYRKTSTVTPAGVLGRSALYARTLNGRVDAVLGSTYALHTPYEERTDPITLRFGKQFSPGAGNGQCNLRYFSAGRILEASASENLLLYGSLTDTDGVLLNFAAIKGIQVIAADENTNDVILGGGSNAFAGPWGSGTESVRPGGVYQQYAPNTGFPVVNTTAHTLKVLNGGGPTRVAYTIHLIGV